MHFPSIEVDETNGSNVLPVYYNYVIKPAKKKKVFIYLELETLTYIPTYIINSATNGGDLMNYEQTLVASCNREKKNC